MDRKEGCKGTLQDFCPEGHARGLDPECLVRLEQEEPEWLEEVESEVVDFHLDCRFHHPIGSAFGVGAVCSGNCLPRQIGSGQS